MHYSKFLFLIGIIFFAVLLWSLGPEKISGIAVTILGANPLIFAIALLMIVPDVLFKGWKQQVLLRAFEKKISLVESTQVWLAGYLLGAISPGRSGDFLRAVYFKKNFGVKLGNGVSAVLLDRLFDVGFLLIAGLLGFIYFSLALKLSQIIIFVLIGVLVLFIAFFLLLTQKRIIGFLARPFFNLFAPKKLREKIRAGFHDFYSGLAEFKKKKRLVFFAAIITIFSWVFFFFQAYFLALSLNLNVPFGLIAAIIPIITLVEIIPISFSGIGTRDFVLVIIFGWIGVSEAGAVSFSLAILLVELIQAFFGAFFLRKIKNI
jgi:uncharacterized protein (TIRG00374 family)